MSGVPESNGDVGSVKRQRCDDDSMGSNSVDSDSGSEGSEPIVEGVQQDGPRVLRSIAELICQTDILPEMIDDCFMVLLGNKARPSLDAIERGCMKIYDEKKVEIKRMLESLDGRINLSLDISRSERDYEKYFCLSAHFIDENWKPKKVVLYFRSFARSDDPNYEGDDWGITRTLEDWGIASKISCFGTNEYCSEMVDFVKSQLQEKKGLQLGGELFRVDCCEEIIMKMVVDTFDKIQYIIWDVDMLSSSKSLSPVWYLTSSKMKSVLELWKEGEYSSERVMKFYDVPSPEEWKEVEGVCKVVDSIYEVTNVLFETKQLTTNVYLYHLHEVHKILTQMSTDSDDFARTVAKNMLEKFDKYWDGMFLLLAIAAAMDPRFKMKYVEFVCSRLKGVDGNSQVAVVLGAIQKLFDEYVISFPETGNCMSDSSSSDSDSEGEYLKPEHGNHTFSVLEDYQQFIQLNIQPAKRSDLECYLEEPVLPWSQDFNALTWWKTADAKYPTLARMARDFLSIPVSLATSYEAFYTETRPVDDRLVLLKLELMNALKCARNWV